MTPKAITCDALRVMCETDGQRAAVMIAVSERGTLFTTWGKSAEDKAYARDLSNHLSDYLECGPRLATHEDFVLDAAKVKEERDAMLAAIRLAVKCLDFDHGPLTDRDGGKPNPLAVMADRSRAEQAMRAIVARADRLPADPKGGEQ